MEYTEIAFDPEFLDDDDRLPKVPKTLRMSRKDMFALAAREFKLTVQSEKTTEIDQDMYITKLEIENMISEESYEKHTKEISGKPALTKNLATENAYHAALKYLENQNRISIDDYNAERVTELKAELLYSKTWSMLFEDKTKKLKNEISMKNMALHELFSSLDSVCQQASAMVPVLPLEQKTSLGKKRRREVAPGARNTDPAPALTGLSTSLMKLRAEFVSLLGTSLDGATLILEKKAQNSSS